LHIHSKEEILRLRGLAQYQSDIGSAQDILTWAQVAGTSLEKADFDRFMSIAHDFQQNPFRQEAMIVFIRLLMESGNFDKARQVAADLCRLEHYVFHALARVRIAKFSGDCEDGALAEEFMRELAEFYTPLQSEE
jgi:hypothetical protein